jgi:hypothetical protein
VSKKKRRKRIKFSNSHQYNSSALELQSSPGESLPPSPPPREATKPLALGGDKDSHGPAVLPFNSAPPLYPADVRVFVGDPPLYIRSIPEWQARDHIHRREAVVIRTSARIRGIRLVKPAVTHELQQGSLATLEQVEGIPVVGPAIKLFYISRRADRPNERARKVSANTQKGKEAKWKKAA